MKLSTTSLVDFGSKILLTVVGFLSTLFFARYLGSGVLGQYFLLIAVVSWLEMSGQVGVNKAVRKRISERESPGAYLAAGAVIQVVLALIVTVSILLGQKLLEQYLGITAGGFVAILVLVRIGYSFVIAGLRGQNQVAKSSGMESGSTVFSSVVQVVLAIALGLGFIGLIYGYIIGFGLITVIGAWFVLRQQRLVVPNKSHFTRLISFARYSWLGELKTRTTAWMDIVVLGFFVSSSLVGIYGTAWRLAAVIVLASNALSEALFPTLSELIAQDDRSKFCSLSEKGILYAGLIPIPSAVGLTIVGSDVLRVYGSEFSQGGLIVGILAFAALFASYEVQFRSILDAIDRPELSFQVNFLYLLTNVTGNVVLTWQFGWIGAAVATSGSMLVSMLLALYFVMESTEISVPTVEIGKQLLASGLMAGVVITVSRYLSSLSYYYIAIPIVLGVVVYGISIITLSTEIRQKATQLTDGFV